MLIHVTIVYWLYSGVALINVSSFAMLNRFPHRAFKGRVNGVIRSQPEGRLYRKAKNVSSTGPSLSFVNEIRNECPLLDKCIWMEEKINQISARPYRLKNPGLEELFSLWILRLSGMFFCIIKTTWIVELKNSILCTALDCQLPETRGSMESTYWGIAWD